MRRILFLFLTATALLASACEAVNESSGNYFVLIVGGEEELSGAFGEYAGNGGQVGELRYIADPEEARIEFPKYSFERTPAIFIFESAGGGEMKKLVLETDELEKAQDFLGRNEGW
jgi:hypothetical protein